MPRAGAVIKAHVLGHLVTVLGRGCDHLAKGAISLESYHTVANLVKKTRKINKVRICLWKKVAPFCLKNFIWLSI